MKENRQNEWKKAQWERQKVFNEQMELMQRDQLRRKLIFFLVFIPGLILAVIGMFYVAMWLPSFLIGV